MHRKRLRSIGNQGSAARSGPQLALAATLAAASVGLLGCRSDRGLLELPPGAGVPADLSVEVLNPDRPPPLRCSPELRLSAKVPLDALEALSRRLLERDAAGCDFGAAVYYLPGMRSESGAWAIAELGPDVAVTILGLTAADEQTLLRRAAAKGEVLGVWVDDTSYASVLSLYRDGGGLKMARWYVDGNLGIEPIRVSRQGANWELRDAGAASRGRHYRLGAGGDLEAWDGGGFLSAARKVRLDVDLGSLIGEEEARRARRARVASAGRSLARAAAAEERWRKFSEWLALYRDGLEPLRHEVLALGELTDPEDREGACTRLARSLEAAPAGIDQVPGRIDVAQLLAGLRRLEDACTSNRGIQILLESAAATKIWQEVDREVAQVVAELRPREEDRR